MPFFPRNNCSTLRPILRSTPDRVRGMPSFREIRDLKPEMPSALFHEKENPNLRGIAEPFLTSVRNWLASVLTHLPSPLKHRLHVLGETF